jgi:uncharacterized small protein (DUF1192 family)
MSDYSPKWSLVPAHVLNDNGTIRVKAVYLNALLLEVQQAELLRQEIRRLKEEHRRKMITFHASYAAVGRNNIPALLQGEIECKKTD